MNTSMHAGPCADYEHEIVELAEGSLAPEKARVVRMHVASCARCRAWQSAFADLDAGLGQALPRPALSADFAARLESRLAAVTRSNGRADLRASAEDEYRRTLEALRRGTRSSAIVGAMTVVGICTAGLLLVRGVAPEAQSVARVIRRTRSATTAFVRSRRRRRARRARVVCLARVPADAATARLRRGYFRAGAVRRDRMIPQHHDLESSVGLPAIPASVAAFELLVESVHPLFLEHVSRRG